MEQLSLGYSPCPNDTFIFYGLVHNHIENAPLFSRPQLEDVETLNSWAMQNRLDVTKLSYHALGFLLDDYCVLHSGSALGRGCGPLLVAVNNIDSKGLEKLRVAIPGRYTTAALLFRMYAPQCTEIVEMSFEKIMESISLGVVDAGVIIHEGRFTYGEHGLVCVQDLGQWWEKTSGHPIPLGCIAARRTLGKTKIKQIDDAIRHSLEFAYRSPEKCLPYIRQHSQELDEKVVQDHIGLYVNEYSMNLGEEGLRAVESFLQKGRQAGILPMSNRGIGY